MVCLEFKEPVKRHFFINNSLSDLHLIQAHLRSLERSNQSASVHTLLFHRLESSMQAMHTPPDTSSALAFPGPSADDSWTIFDQEIMSLANPPWLFEESTQLPQMQKSFAAQQLQTVLPSVQYGPGMLESTARHFEPSTRWDCPDPMAGALSSTLNPILGNESNTQNGNLGMP
jgi:hypothetical protein